MRRRSNAARHHWRLLLHPSVDNSDNGIVIALNMDGHSGVLWLSQLERSCNQLKHNQNNALNCFQLFHLKLWPPSPQRIVRMGSIQNSLASGRITQLYINQERNTLCPLISKLSFLKLNPASTRSKPRGANPKSRKFWPASKIPRPFPRSGSCSTR